jgi:hypothetical protein
MLEIKTNMILLVQQLEQLQAQIYSYHNLTLDPVKNERALLAKRKEITAIRNFIILSICNIPHLQAVKESFINTHYCTVGEEILSFFFIRFFFLIFNYN